MGGGGEPPLPLPPWAVMGAPGGLTVRYQACVWSQGLTSWGLTLPSQVVQQRFSVKERPQLQGKARAWSPSPPTHGWCPEGLHPSQQDVTP